MNRGNADEGNATANGQVGSRHGAAAGEMPIIGEDHAPGAIHHLICIAGGHDSPAGLTNLRFSETVAVPDPRQIVAVPSETGIS
jgi:hypothetical protein